MIDDKLGNKPGDDKGGKKAKTITFSTPNDAFDYMNMWTQMKESYETRFVGKEVTKVDIRVDERDRPLVAHVHYKKEDNSIGTDTIDLASYMLLKEPDEQWKPAKHMSSNLRKK